MGVRKRRLLLWLWLTDKHPVRFSADWLAGYARWRYDERMGIF
jgi:hypothetical protein